MTELQQFKTFFRNQGVLFDTKEQEFRGALYSWLIVSGSGFLFNARGRFVGTLANDLTTFTAKEF